MTRVQFTESYAIVEAKFEYADREWSGIGATQYDALNHLLQEMAVDVDWAARAPFGLDIEEFLGECAGHNDVMAGEVERLTDRNEELEVLTQIMAQQYYDQLAQVVVQRDEARSALVDLRMRNAFLEDQLDLQRELA